MTFLWGKIQPYLLMGKPDRGKPTPCSVTWESMISMELFREHCTSYADIGQKYSNEI